MDELINRYRTSINPPYKFKDYLNLTLTFLILLAVPVTIFLSQNKQDIRQRAQEVTPGHLGRPETPSVPDEILLKFKPGVPEKAKENIRNSHGIKVEEVIKQIDVERGKVPAEARDRIIEALKKNPQVEYAEPNFLAQVQDTPNDPLYPTNQWFLKKISAPSAWDVSKGSSSVVVAVIDSGAQSTHEDLVGKLVPGYNFYDNNTDTSDVTGHGTAVTGIVGATTNNGKGVASLGRDVSIMPLRVTSTSGFSDYYKIAQATTYAADHGVKAINISLGGSATDNTLQDAINYAWSKGLVIAAAAGNDGACCVLYPAAANNVVAVGATTGSDTKASFSNTGSQLDVMAPGISIYTTGLGNIYGFTAGTSISSPQVSALAALIFSANPGLTNQQVVDIIDQTADKVDSTNHPYTDLITNNCSGWNDYYGCGRINAYAALQKATGITPPPPDTTPPTTSITSPAGGTVSGLVDITANATDNIGVTKVEFYIDGSLFATDVTSPSPFLASWDTTLYTNSSHTILVKAYDLANNVGSSSSVTVTVSNISPTPTSTSPPPATPTPTSSLQSTVVTFSNISVQTTTNTATVNWTTNISSTSRVAYGTSSTNLNLSTVENPTSVINHTVTLTNLAPNTRYYYKVLSKNSLGDEFSSSVKNFKTKNR